MSRTLPRVSRGFHVRPWPQCTTEPRHFSYSNRNYCYMALDFVFLNKPKRVGCDPVSHARLFRSRFFGLIFFNVSQMIQGHLVPLNLQKTKFLTFIVSINSSFINEKKEKKKTRHLFYQEGKLATFYFSVFLLFKVSTFYWKIDQ